MPIPKKVKPLTELLASLEFPDPATAAQQFVDGSMGALLATLFVRQAWTRAVQPGDAVWIDSEIARAKQTPDAPYAGLGLALERCRNKGVSDDDLIEMARCLQGAMIFQVCYLLEDPSFSEPALEDVNWGLFQINDNDRPFGQQIVAMHELVLGEEPGQREMRPK